MDSQILLDDIQACYQIAGASISAPMIQRQIDRIRRDGDAITRNTQSTHDLATLIARNMQLFIKSDIAQALGKTELFVIPLPLCVAYSKLPQQIIIGDGLLNVITACGYWGYVCEALPEALSDITPFDDFPTLSVQDAIPVLLFALIDRHYHYGEPLPNVREWALHYQPTIDTQVQVATAGAATFVVCPALGHLALNHNEHGDATLRPYDVSFPVEQSLSNYQLQELEADNYAMMAIKDDYRPLYTAWMDMALCFHLQRETVLSERGEKHPITINRLQYAHSRCYQGEQQNPRTYYEQHLQHMGQSFNHIEQAHHELKAKQRPSLFALFSREEIIQRLSVVAPYLGDQAVYLDNIINDTHPFAHWKDCFEEA